MIEVLKQALEALNEYVDVVVSVNDPNDWRTVADGGKPARDAITSLRQAIAELESQEPVAWFTQARNFVPLDECTKEEAKLYGWNELYLRPPQRKPLTDEQIDQIYFRSDLEIDRQYNQLYGFARAIEAAHGIKE